MPDPEVLFGYPIAATTDNWVHDSIVEMVRLVHENVDAGTDIPGWPELIPAQYRDSLRKRWGFRDRIARYSAAIQNLDANERERVFRSIVEQNDIVNLLSCNTDCESLVDLPLAIRNPLESLFEFGFDKLTDFGTRDAQYAAIYAHCPKHVCPFCGCEFFDAPGARREELDHYLAKDLYPSAAANLRNLVPMGGKCNRYKLAEDILRDEHGNRRRVFYPYDHEELEVQLSNSVPFGGDDGFTPNWEIEFIPDSEECATWDAVFKIRERYIRDVLDPFYKKWLNQFGRFCRLKEIHNPADEDLNGVIDEFIQTCEIMDPWGPDFLQLPVFRMIQNFVVAGDERFVAVMRDLATAGSGAPIADAA